MEKTLRKEKGENLAGQASSLNVNQREEAAGKSETRPNPGRGGRDLREKKTDSNCVACCKDKKRGVPPKTRWKEEQKEKARSQEAQGKENRTVAVPGPGKTTAAPGTEGSETQHALRETQKSAEDPKKKDAQAPVTCMTGVPRGPASVGELARVTPSGNGGRTPQETLHEINQQYLRSKYKFKEGAPLKEYLRQRVPNFGETCTLLEVLTWQPIHDSRGCTAGGSVKEKESARERDSGCGATAADDGGSKARPFERGVAGRRHNVPRESARCSSPRSQGNDDSSQHPKRESRESD
jgi:hypothetical protein